MSFVISLIFVIALAVLFGWLATRAWRARRAAIKWPGVIISGLLAVLCVLVGGVALLGLYKLYLPPTNPAPGVQVDRSPEQLARGERLAYLCVGCHSSTGQLPMDGKAEENFPSTIGRVYASNLTPGGPLKDWSDGEIIRAIREGVDKREQALLIMPSAHYHSMSDTDVQALVAYLRTQPAVDRPTLASELSFMGTALVGAGILPTSTQPPVTAPVEAPLISAGPEYGQYLVIISGCGECHGEDLRGGDPDGFAPVGPNLPAVVSSWSTDEFVQTIRTSVAPNGHSINPETMPTQDYSAAYTDEELRAMYEYIRSLTPPAESSQ